MNCPHCNLIAKVESEMFELSQIGERLRTQDNRITAEPIFLVEQIVRDYGLDPRWTDGDGVVWIRDGDEYGPKTSQFKAREKKWQLDGTEPDDWNRCIYRDRYEFVTCCFTEAAADRYIEENRHNLKSPRTYVASAYRNREWIEIRKFLMGQKQEASA